MSHHLEDRSDLFHYFYERTLDAQAAVEVQLSSDTVLYLARLLTERARADHPTLPESTLAELYGRAVHAPPSEQARAYRELGDRALYRLGCFKESLDRGPVGPRYYEDMGASAYYRVDQVFKRWFADAFGPVFRELSGTFRDCVELLTVVNEQHIDDDAATLMRLVDEWQRTRSDAIARRLRARHIPIDDLRPA
ncbi:MAG: hypothetical protein EA397_03790 [Deltaproteobacteria bacterium]|nr:MAG: hypothetical protein EA397_03790 [Deltaproteobacteria bacterium]